MQVCFVSQDGLTEYLQSSSGVESAEKKVGITVFSFHGDEICYERELKGETQFFESVARLSKRLQGLVICGVVTSTHGHKRKSVIVAENGRILGVSDGLHARDGEVHSGAYLRVYETKIGRVGVAVAEDLYDGETVKTLALCGSDFIVCPFECVKDSLCSVLLRAYAFISGVPILFCGKGYSMIADADGGIAFASPISPVFVDFSVRKEFHLFETRRKMYLGEK